MSVAESGWDSLIVRAEAHLASGEIDAARQIFGDAAREQEAFVRSLPPERMRTWATFSLSAATLYYRAQEIDRAARIAHAALASESVDAYCADRLEELLSRIRSERVLAELGVTLSERPITVTFRGGSIVEGLAPADRVDTAIHAVLSISRRLAAYRSGLDLSRAPQPQLTERYRAWISEPAVGSYRIDLYLSGPSQLSFDLDTSMPGPDASKVIDDTLTVIARAVRHDTAPMSEVVDNEAYRSTILRLVRNVVPDGRDVGEVELRLAGDAKEHAVALRPNDRDPVNELIRAERPPRSPANGAEVVTIRGTLRAVDLDSRRLRLDQPDGAKAELKLPEYIADDVLGPLLNRRVAVRVYPNPRAARLVVQDIELEETGDAPASGHLAQVGSNVRSPA